MNKELTDKLLEQSATIMQMLIDGINKTKDFALEQLPDIVLQYVLFYRVYLTSQITIAILAIVVVIFWAKYWFKRAIQPDTEGFPEVLAGGLPGVIVTIPSLICIFDNFKNLVMVWAAPKVFLITQLVELAKTK